MLENVDNINSSLANYRESEIQDLERYQDLLKKHATCPLVQLYNFPRVSRTQEFTKLLALYEMYKLVQDVHGSFIEIGVLEGFNIFALGHFCEIFEHRNYTRRIFGFDTFEGYGSFTPKDPIPESVNVLQRTSSLDLLTECVDVFNEAIAFNQFRKIELVKGDAAVSIPAFLERHPELVVSLLMLQTDIYEPTKAALELLYPRMPKGSVVSFVALNYPPTPGETSALAETIGLDNVELRRFPFATKISYFIKK